MMMGPAGGGSQFGGPSAFGLDKGRARSGTGKSSDKGGKKGFLSSFSGESQHQSHRPGWSVPVDGRS